jgi:hypothetical protein
MKITIHSDKSRTRSTDILVGHKEEKATITKIEHFEKVWRCGYKHH